MKILHRLNKHTSNLESLELRKPLLNLHYILFSQIVLAFLLVVAVTGPNSYSIALSHYRYDFRDDRIDFSLACQYILDLKTSDETAISIKDGAVAYQEYVRVVPPNGKKLQIRERIPRVADEHGYRPI